MQAPDGPLHRLGFWFAVAIAGLLFGRLIEFTGHLTALRPAMVLLTVATAISIVTSRITRPFSSGIASLFLGFTVWSIAGLPFSVWRGGAVSSWIHYWFSSLLCYIVIATLVSNLAQCRQIMYAIAASMLVLTGMSFFRASARMGSGLGRYGFDTGTLHNANLLAMVLLMGVPFCLLAVRRWQGVKRVVPLFGVLLMTASILRTGSRAGLVTVLLLGMMVFFRLTVAGKLQLLVAGGVMVATGLALSEEGALSRFRTLLGSGENAQVSIEELAARESTESRAEMLKRSLVQTARNPIFGVGTGMFMIAEDNEARELYNRQGSWLVSHNAYTQLSSETGIPGALLYIGAMYLCFRKMRAIETAARNIPALSAVSDMAFTLRLSLTAYAIESFFASTAYECYFPILAGLMTSVDLAAGNLIRANSPALESFGAAAARTPYGGRGSFTRAVFPSPCAE